MQRIRIPKQPDELTPEWLTHLLRRSSMLPPGAAVRRIDFDDPGREASYAGYVTRMRIEYDTAVSAPRSIIAKFPAPEAPIRYIFQSLYRNETLFYRQLAETSPVSIPTCYAALINRKQTRSLLLLEDLTKFAVVGDHETGCTNEQARIALGRIARLHGTWWESPRLESTTWLGRYQVRSARNWLIYASAWAPFHFRLRHVTPPRTLKLFQTLWRYRSTLQQMERGRPRTLQHGDFRLANLAFTPDDIYLFDWQVIRSGLPLFDVAWFMLTSLTIAQRRQDEGTLLRAYHSALIEAGVSGYSMEELINDYRLALLLTIPQIMVIGAFLRIDAARIEMLGKLLRRYDAAREDHGLDGVVRRGKLSQ